MTSKESMEFYALVGPDVARHIAEGGRIMGPVVEVSLGYKDGKPGFVIKGPSKEWKDAGEKINQILDVELGRLPPRTKNGSRRHHQVHLLFCARRAALPVPDRSLVLGARRRGYAGGRGHPALPYRRRYTRRGQSGGAGEGPRARRGV